jgi:hypothetical protein
MAAPDPTDLTPNAIRITVGSRLFRAMVSLGPTAETGWTRDFKSSIVYRWPRLVVHVVVTTPG